MKNMNREIKPISKENLQIVMNLAKSVLAEYEDYGEPVKLSVSTGNRKIGKCLNLSTMPGLSCGNSTACLDTCYAIRSATYYRTCIKAWSKNLYMVRHHLADTFCQMDAKMSRRKSEKYLRLHVAGELESADELEMFIGLARLHPEYQCWTYTKMYKIVNDYLDAHDLPENCHIMFSAWGVKMAKCISNPHHLPIFLTVLEGEEIPDGWDKCPGRCDECKAEHSTDGKCHGCIGGKNTYTLHHY